MLGRSKTPRPAERRPPPPDELIGVPGLENLEEISMWLGTFRERLRLARGKDRPKLEAAMKELEAQYRRRRAELS